MTKTIIVSSELSLLMAKSWHKMGCGLALKECLDGTSAIQPKQTQRAGFISVSKSSISNSKFRVRVAVFTLTGALSC